jgi:hypothetical protein
MQHLTVEWNGVLRRAAKAGATKQRELTKRVAREREVAAQEPPKPKRPRRDVQEIVLPAIPPLPPSWVDEDAITAPYSRSRP